MSKTLSLHDAARRMLDVQKILILNHRRPDGDTIGCSAALCRALRKAGKTAFVYENEDLTPRLSFLVTDLFAPKDFVPELVVAVDIADEQLLTPGEAVWAGKIDLCFDHHPSNTGYAREMVLHEHAAAAAEVIYLLLPELGVEPDLSIWEALYIAVATDTGCFRFSNTTPLAHRIAADAIEAGLDFHPHNRTFFEMKSKNRFLIERKMFDDMYFSEDGRVVCAVLDRPWLNELGASDDDLDNLSTLTMSLENVDCGIILTQNKNDSGYKVSVRTHKPANASEICSHFGGGGHPRAAGCSISGPAEEAAAALVRAAKEELARC